MAPVASLYVVNVANISAYSERGQEIEDAYFWSGSNLLFLIHYLWQERGISLFSVAYHDLERRLNHDGESATIIISAEHKPLLEQLHPSNHDVAELRRALIARGVASPEAAVSAVDGLTLLHEQLSALPDDCALVIHVS